MCGGLLNHSLHICKVGPDLCGVRFCGIAGEYLFYQLNLMPLSTGYVSAIIQLYYAARNSRIISARLCPK
jgi:hypothetical protein